jgi:hypothetical protein
MPQYDVYMKEGDREPALVATLVDQDNSPVPLNTATGVEFFMIEPQETTPKINGSSVNVIDAANGRVSYPWGANDTDDPGEYNGEFRVTWAGGNVTKFPNFRYLKIKVAKSIVTTD